VVEYWPRLSDSDLARFACVRQGLRCARRAPPGPTAERSVRTVIIRGGGGGGGGEGERVAGEADGMRERIYIYIHQAPLLAYLGRCSVCPFSLWMLFDQICGIRVDTLLPCPGASACTPCTNGTSSTGAAPESIARCIPRHWRMKWTSIKTWFDGNGGVS
jgi:hypothetical protein